MPPWVLRVVCARGHSDWSAASDVLENDDGVSQFADYIEDHSRYGSQAFSLSLSDAVQLYKYSLEKYFETRGQPTLDIVFKKAGTKRYQRYVGYILVVCAKINGHDLLPNFASKIR